VAHLPRYHFPAELRGHAAVASVFWVEPDRITMAVSPLGRRRYSNRSSKIIVEKESAQRPIFTCKSATEELGEKAMLPRDTLGAKYVAMASPIDAGDDRRRPRRQPRRRTAEPAGGLARSVKPTGRV
jgi:hypothetical protein